MKKPISLFLAFIMAFALAGTASAEGGTPTFVVSEETAAPGEEVRVTINVENNPGFCSATLYVDYDTSVLELTDVEQGDYTTGLWKVMAPKGDVIWVGGQDSFHDGVFATLIFNVKADAPAGDYEVSVHYFEDDVFEKSEENVYFAVQAGKVTVTGSGAPAAISGHRLLLSSEIGVQFKVTVPAKTDTSGWYMRFDYSDGRPGATQRIDEATKANDTAYWFTAYINPLELADTITATLYCKDKTIVNTYSAMTYFNTARASLSDRANVIKIVNALQDYGHYLLASGWTDGKKHAAIKAASGSLNVETARTGVSGMAAVKELKDTGVSEAAFELTLNGKAQIDVSVQLEKGVSIAAEKGTYIELPDGRFRFSTAKIGPKNLASVWTVPIKTSKGTAKVKASAMSYVYAVLNDGGFTKAQQQAMAAFYFYHCAARDY